MASKSTHVGELIMFGLESLGSEPEKEAIPFPARDMGSLQSDTTYVYKGRRIYVEYVKGDKRSGRDPQGNAWESIMPCAYGYWCGTLDADGEDVDVYISSEYFDEDAPIIVIDQVNPDNQEFDEHKTFLGFSSTEDALNMYRANIPDANKRIGEVKEFSQPDFYQWVMSSGPKSPLGTEPDQRKLGTVAKTVSQVEIRLPATDQAPKIVIRKRPKGVAIEIYILSEFNYDTWKSMPDTIVDLLRNAGEDDTVMIGISSYGGDLDLAARIASAIRACRAPVHTVSLGPVASAGCLVWCEGGIRLISRGSYFMQHEAGTGLCGKTTQIAKDAQAVSEYVKGIIFPRMASFGLFTEKEIDNMVERGCDVFISSSEAADRTKSEMV